MNLLQEPNRQRLVLTAPKRHAADSPGLSADDALSAEIAEQVRDRGLSHISLPTDRLPLKFVKDRKTFDKTAQDWVKKARRES